MKKGKARLVPRLADKGMILAAVSASAPPLTRVSHPSSKKQLGVEGLPLMAADLAAVSRRPPGLGSNHCRAQIVTVVLTPGEISPAVGVPLGAVLQVGQALAPLQRVRSPSLGMASGSIENGPRHPTQCIADRLHRVGHDVPAMAVRRAVVLRLRIAHRYGVFPRRFGSLLVLLRVLAFGHDGLLRLGSSHAGMALQPGTAASMHWPHGLGRQPGSSTRLCASTQDPNACVLVYFPAMCLPVTSVSNEHLMFKFITLCDNWIHFRKPLPWRRAALHQRALCWPAARRKKAPTRHLQRVGAGSLLPPSDQLG